MARVLRDETLLEYFREQVVAALQRQKVEASAFTEYYLVDLLARCVEGRAAPPADPGEDAMPLSLLYLRALHAASRERARLLRAMGDTALFVSGFFPESVEDRVGDLRFYHRLGGDAYRRLSCEREDHGAFAPDVFSELAARFREFADVLTLVSETSRALSGPASVLRLYERWLQTGSRLAAERLAREGVAPAVPATEGWQH
jgi:hypothetical protein